MDCKKKCPLQHNGKCLSGDAHMVFNPSKKQCEEVKEYFKRKGKRNERTH